MRDPGTPRRNPFFEHGSEADASDLGMGWRDQPDAESDAGVTGPKGRASDREDPSAGSDPQSDRPSDWSHDWSSEPMDAAGGFAMLMGLVEGLGDAQPEAAEHLVAAAHEVVLTVKVLVDATEAVLAQQRATMAAHRSLRLQRDGE